MLDDLHNWWGGDGKTEYAGGKHVLLLIQLINSYTASCPLYADK